MDEAKYIKLVEHRTHLVELSNNQIGLFDKSTLALSTGALGISILFLDKLTDLLNIVDVEYLIYSWILLLATILLNLASYLSSWSENRKLVKIIDDAIIEGDAEQFYKNSKERKLTRTLNYVCLITFSVGVILLAVFALKNLEGSSDGKATKHTTSTKPAEASLAQLETKY